MATVKDEVKKLAGLAGIKFNGKNAWDIQVHDERLYQRLLAHGSMGLGESYMDGWWTSRDLESTVERLLRARLDTKVKPNLQLARNYIGARLGNAQSIGRAKRNARSHYDIGNDLYQPMLGQTMAYSCGYWKGVRSLDAAQVAKFELIARKLKLKAGMRVLDIGCGWGGLATHLARKYKVEVVGLTPAKEQAAYIRTQVAKNKGLKVKVVEQDYREYKSTRKFDRIVSVGMFEHVGPTNYQTFLDKAESMMVDDGIFLLHTIGNNISASSPEPWIGRYIFPGAVLPSIAQLARACEGEWVIEDLHNFGPDYEKTLLAWYRNFKKAWPKLQDKYGERFYRTWEFYLLCCAASFKTRNIQLWQFVLTKQGQVPSYESTR